MPQVPHEFAPAPQIPGYTYLRPVGHGGFSDVYLYEQTMPRREVAIKVLRTDDLSENTREQFAAEANLMARVSNHSNIVAIHAADVDDEGQPYLVMEYCPGGSLGAFYRHYPMSVKDVLSLGIRLSGALEAAHRAGIVHRDVKPGNILLTEYGVPVLSDFGISTIDEDLPPEATRRMDSGSRPGTGESSVGMSLPWAAPETLWEVPVSDARSDRYSLAATLYSLLEGHSPHEVPGGPNSGSHLAGRIQSGFVAAMRRPDVPPSLQAVLRKGLAHDRAARYDSAADIGRALQDVQRELGLEVTPLDVPRGEIDARPPAVGTRVQQSQPIRLPEGHATLLPPDPGQAPPAPDGSGVPPGPSQPAPVATPSAATIAPPSARGSRPPHRWDRPVGAQPAPVESPVPMVMAGGPPPPAGWARWRIPAVILIGVLVVACVVVASLLIARAGARPTYSGPEIDNLQPTLTGSGGYDVAIPEELPIPEAVQVRVLDEGDGDPLGDASWVELSTDSSDWGDGETVYLNPLESANQNETVTIETVELAETLGIDVSTLHRDAVVLVAAPRGYFANLHPDLEIRYSDATLVIMKVMDAY